MTRMIYAYFFSLGRSAESMYSLKIRSAASSFYIKHAIASIFYTVTTKVTNLRVLKILTTIVRPSGN